MADYITVGIDNLLHYVTNITNHCLNKANFLARDIIITQWFMSYLQTYTLHYLISYAIFRIYMREISFDISAW